MTSLDVEQEALRFGQELQDLLDDVLPVARTARDDDRRVQVIAQPGGQRFLIQVTEPRGLITLVRNAEPVALLRVVYWCVANSDRQFLAIHRSDFEFRSMRDRSPVFRLDYLRDAHRVPTAHWNIHAERGTVSHLLGQTNPDHSGQFSEIHFPVGGARLRPCLEDFLHLVITEFRIDTHQNAMTVLGDGRERWRRRQVATLVRDAPDEAVRVLTELGYSVTDPADGAVLPRPESLRRW